MRDKIIAALALAGSAWACHQAILTAPGGAVMTLFANPTFICANGCTSTISAILIEADTNTPVADGTVVQFFTTLGQIPEQGKTNDGVVRVNLTADGRSGVAAITAFSGAAMATLGGSTGGVPSSNPTPTPDPSASPTNGGGGGGGTSNNSGSGVTIGNTNVENLFVVADPQRIRPQDARITTITVTATDAAGNPAPGVPVSIRTSADNGENEEEVETPQPQFTDSSGRARFVVRTRRNREAEPKLVTVIATAADGTSNSDTKFTVN